MLGSLCVSKGRAKREVVPITFLCFFFLKAGTIEPNPCYMTRANAVKRERSGALAYFDGNFIIILKTFTSIFPQRLRQQEFS